ncbi:MAG: MBL fold metallo-hydrolase [Defluviitaleaceae bacterium]|nr:MBL fold metallo-hydrolase [Defluviitaleaceae bacterium]
MKPIKITDRNIMFTEPMEHGYGLNLGLILGTNYNYVIDTGLGSGSVTPILEYIGNNVKPIIVVNTHSHWDHVWGNWIFDKSLIISHTTCRDLLIEQWDDSLHRRSEYIDGEVRKCLPNLVFDASLHFPGDGISIFHTPGHTADCISVYDAVEKVLYAGDNIGDTDEEIVPHINTDIGIFQRMIKFYKELDFDFCVSGHNKPQTKAVLARMEASLPEAWKKQQNIG